ncbi:MAG: DUF2157 domain-containing protein [Kiritimatiellae bacterium]|nr:DUF2157 domain-containing protein [Kiritimatiellia bacterium]
MQTNEGAIRERRREIEEIDLKIAELKKRRKELLAESGENRLSVAAIIVGSFGALLIGLGLIALFAANWQTFGREARAAISFLPVLLCGGLAITAAIKGWRSHALWEPLGIFWCVTIGAATCLIAQTYNVGGSVPGLLLFVAFLTLPVVWTTRAATPTALWPLLPIIWGCQTAATHEENTVTLIVKSLAFLALSLPGYIAFLKSRPPKAALVPVQIATGLIYSLGLGILLCTIIPYRERMFILYIHCFWACAALVGIAAWLCSLPVWRIVATLVAAGTAFSVPFSEEGFATYGAALLLAAGILAYGISTFNTDKLRLSYTNIGGITLLWLIVAKFFESEVSFTIKGLILIGAGTVLTLLNLLLIRYHKRRVAQ